MDIKKKTNNPVTSQKSSTTQPSKKRKFFGFLKGFSLGPLSLRERVGEREIHSSSSPVFGRGVRGEGKIYDPLCHDYMTSLPKGEKVKPKYQFLLSLWERVGEREKLKPSLSLSTKTSLPRGEKGGFFLSLRERMSGTPDRRGFSNLKKIFNTRNKKVALSFLFILFLVLPAYFIFFHNKAGASWWNSDWNYRRSITINSAQIPGDLNNFPMLVSFTDSNLINKTQSNGNDIIFIEENGTRLNHEIEKFDSTTGELVAWVRIPQLEGDYDTTLYMYYGNQTVDNQQRPEDVWDDNFKTVQHLEEGGTGTRYDSTRSNTDATTQNFNGDESISSARINGGADLEDDDNTYFDLGTPEALNISQQITLSAWVRVESDNNSRIISKSGASSNLGYILARRAAIDSFDFSISTNGTNWDTSSSDSVFNTGTWYYVVGTYDGTTKRMFINGSEESNATLPKVLGANMNVSTVSTQIGRDEGYGNDGYIFDGIIDEVRISNTARSANWITTEYNNQNSPSTFISLGQEERGSAPALYLPFDEGFGSTAHDESSNRNDGTIVGATWKDESMCKSGKCLEFDGTGDYVEIADDPSLDLSEEMTLEAWVKPTSTTPQNQTIISKVETPTEPTKIYRSVGPSATTAITVGTSNTMTIVGDRATFATALPDNVGVGDVIQYDDDDDGDIDSSDSLAFVTERISNFEFRISNVSGGTPVPVNSDNNWSLFRAYTSLANAEKGVENTGIDSDLRNFDDWTAGGDATTDDVGKDLVAANQQWNIACYANGTTADTTVVIVNGWTTGVNNFVNIYTPVNSSEVGVTQRHGGKWDTSKYYIDNSGTGNVIDLAEENFRFDGLQIRNSGSTASRFAMMIQTSLVNIDIRLSNSILRGNGGNVQPFSLNSNITGNFYAWNNIFYDAGSAVTYNAVSFSNCPGTKIYFYNNTVFGGYNGINRFDGTIILKNNIVQNSTVSFNGTFDYTSANNISSNVASTTNAFGATYTSSTTNATTASKLINSAETFISKGVQVGSIIKNTTDNTYTYVTALDSETQLSIANDIFVSGEAYSIYKNKYGNVSFVSTTAGSEDFHLSPTDTVAKNSGADLSGDNFFPFNNDIDGQQRLDPQEGGTTAWDIGADEARATQIYRSVAPNKTDALETGAENSLTIVGNTATFQRALADNVGVGDVIQYDDDNDGDIDTNDSLAFIVARITNYEYRITNASGAVPAQVINDNDWSLFRAYTSLANAENGTENTGIDSDLRNFDSWTGGKDLVTSKEQWNIACYANGTTPDSTVATVDGWTTGIQNFVKVYTPVSESEVGVSQRHNGKWDTSKYYFLVNATRIIYILDSYVQFDGFQVEGTSNNYGGGYLTVDNSTGAIIKNNIIRVTKAYKSHQGIWTDNGTRELKIYNNVIYGFSLEGMSIRADFQKINYIYNNTIANSSSGITASNNGIMAKNNLIYNCTVAFYDGDGYFVAGTDYNATNNASMGYTVSGGGNIHDKVSQTINFIDVPAYDFHLSKTDTAARNAGVNLANDPNLPITTDIDGDSRLRQGSGVAQWDIGADEAVATKIYRSVGPGNTSPLVTDDAHDNEVEVTDGVATFEVDLPDRIGVGDAVIIDTGGTANAIDASDTLLFIHGRIDSKNYLVRTHTGALPSDITSNDTYSLYRAYTSLSNAEAGIKNTSIPMAFNGGNRDLVTNNEEWNIACYGDGVDTATVNVDGWITGVENFIKIYTPVNRNEVGISQRHSGKWNEGKYALVTSGSFDLHDNYVKVEGFQVRTVNVTVAGTRVISAGYLDINNNIQISNSIIRGHANPAYWQWGINIGDLDANVNIYNVIIYDIENTDGVVLRVSDANKVYVYNSTLIGGKIGLRNVTGTTYVKNVLVKGSATGDFVETGGTLYCNNCASGDATADDQNGDGVSGNNKINQTFSFRDEANDDYRLAMTDTAAKGAGLNLSYDANIPVTHDIEGELRPSLRDLSTPFHSAQDDNTKAWDIGADQISNTVHNNYSLNLKTNYPQANFSTGDNDQDNFSSGDINLEPNEWSHLVYKRSNDIEEMYINGSKKDSGTISNFLKTNNGKLYLGAKDSNSKNSFKGFLDEVRIYPYARTEAEVKKDTTQGSSGRAASRASEGVSVSIGETGNSLSDGLVGYWKMDEASWNGTVNEVKDASGNNNHGIRYGNATTGAGKFGNGGAFDGTGDYVQTGQPVYMSNGFSVSSWARVENNNLYNQLGIVATSTFNSSNGFVLEYRDNGSDDILYIRIGTGSSDNLNFSDECYLNWCQYAFTYEPNGNVIGYVNGKKIGNFQASSNFNISSRLNIGQANSGNDEYFNGKIDETRIYSRVLSEDEIKQLYKYAPGPVLHLKMDEKSGTTAYDSSGNNNHGTLVNGPIWETGKINGGLKFNGSSTSVTTPTSPILEALDYNITISGWFKGLGNSVNSSIISTYNGFGSGYIQVRYESNGSITVKFMDGISPALNSVINLNDDKWHFLTIIRNVNDLKNYLYIDGKLIDQDISGSNKLIDWEGCPVTLGNGFGYFKGLLDDFKIYNYARTQEKILEDMNAQSSSIIGSEGNVLQKPILDLNFDEGQGATAYDSSGNNNHGTLVSGTTGSNTTTTAMWDKGGKKNGAMEFDGDDYVDVGNIDYSNFENEISISAWVKKVSLNGNDFIVSTYNGSTGMYFDTYGDNSFQWRIGGTEHSGSFSFDTGQWYHLVGTYNQEKVILYIDGKEIYRASEIDPIEIIQATKIGSNIDGTNFYWDGLIDDVKIYNYALSEDEVKTLYNDSSAMVMGNDENRDNNGTEVTGANKDYCIPGDTAKCDKPVLELKMDEMTGTIAKDTSGNGNNGTLTNGPIWEPNGKIGSALKFDGVDSYVQTTNTPLPNSPTNGFTASLWFKAERKDGTFMELGGSSAMYTSMTSSGVSCNIRNKDPDHTINTSRFNNSTNNWYYLSCVLDPATNLLSMYVDGSLKSSVNASTFTAFQNNGLLSIGARGNYGGISPFPGYIDDVKIYDYARTPAQIAWDYNQGKPINHWTFDEGTGSTVHDEGPNLNNGTITGATWKNESECKNGKCLYFDGLDTTRVDADTQDNMSQFTACAWVNPKAWTNTSGDSEMFIFNKGFTLRLLNDGKIDFRHSTSGSYPYRTTNDSIVLDEWSRVCGVYRGVSVSPEVYVNGKNMPGTGEAGNGTADDDSASILRIGSYGNEWYGNFYGYIDDPKIYNYALTAEQVKEDYNGGAVNFK